MKNIIVLLTLLSTSLVFAGPGHGDKHGHGHSHDAPKAEQTVSKEKTEKIARFHIKRLISADKLHKSWATASYEKSIKKKFKNRKEWVVTFNNEKGVKGKKLYIFLRLSGKYVAANFTGK